MPIYEYQCAACGHQLEVIQKMTDQPLKTCPSCNKDQLHKQISAAGFQLKGGGWYVTDYSGKGKKSGQDKDKPDADKKEGPAGENKGSATSGKTES